MINQIKAYYEREIAAIHSMDFAELEAAVQAIKAAYDRGGTIYTFAMVDPQRTLPTWCATLTKALAKTYQRNSMSCA